MFILDSLLIGSLRFVLDKIAAAAEAELHDETPHRERLLEAEMRLELGELSRAEFALLKSSARCWRAFGKSRVPTRKP
jgi:hypothetical protein